MNCDQCSRCNYKSSPMLNCSRCSRCKQKNDTSSLFNFCKLLGAYEKILIPKIQRDYAQGRRDKKAQDVRNNLLSDIFSDKKIHFDFIFGTKSQDGKCFIPIDGQQRLTTLFLLYLYRYVHTSSKCEEPLKKLQNFSYDTRRAARDFCIELVKNRWEENSLPSENIKNAKWFMDYWQYDPTIAGMLCMLDEIHQKANGVATFPDLDAIQFYVFDMDAYKLNETLYLKMNSRGRPLTAFENFKASVEQWLENKVLPFLPQGNTFQETWSLSIDNEWTNLVWERRGNSSFDTAFIQFICRFLLGQWEIYGGEDQSVENALKEACDATDSDFIPFAPIQTALSLQDNSIVVHLANMLQNLCTDKFDEKIQSAWGAGSTNELTTYKKLAVFQAHLMISPSDTRRASWMRASWMRVCWNLIENDVEDQRSYISFCKRIAIFRDGLKTGNFYTWLVTDGAELLKKSQLLDSAQMQEEIEKASQIVRSTNGPTETEIREAERYAFFRGRIGFLYHDANGKPNWSDFKQKFTNAKCFFDKNGITPIYSQQNFLLRRLLYLSVKKTNNHQPYCDWINYGNGATNWRQILSDNNAQGIIHDLLINPIFIYRDVYEKYSNLDKVLQSGKDFSGWHIRQWNVRGRNYVVLTKYSNAISNVAHRDEIIILDDPRLGILENYRKEISSQGSLNINFTYTHDNIEYHFQWYGFPKDNETDIYLLDGSGHYWQRPEFTDGQSDKQNYYCAEVQSNATDLVNTLDGLIQDVPVHP